MRRPLDHLTSPLCFSDNRGNYPQRSYTLYIRQPSWLAKDIDALRVNKTKPDLHCKPNRISISLNPSIPTPHYTQLRSLLTHFLNLSSSSPSRSVVLIVPTCKENMSDEDVVELSDSSPAKPTPRHQPSDEECNLAEELLKCPSIPTLALIAPLLQQQWDLFHSTLTSNKQAYVLT
ncbi:hypothetical protein YC2023_119414 [Brassica napus]